MNIIAVDIGNSTITVGLFVDNDEKFIESVGGGDRDRISDLLIDAWGQFPFVKSDKVHKREGVIVVSSVKLEWCAMVKEICAAELD